MRVSKERKLESQISFLKPQDASTEGLWAAWLPPPCDQSWILPRRRTCFPERASSHLPGDPHVPARPRPGAWGVAESVCQRLSCPCPRLLEPLGPQSSSTAHTTHLGGLGLGSGVKDAQLLVLEKQRGENSTIRPGRSSGRWPISPTPRL